MHPQAPIDFVTEDAVLAELLDRYRASGRHILLWHAAEAPDPAAVQLQLQEQALARGEEARARALAAQQAELALTRGDVAAARRLHEAALAPVPSSAQLQAGHVLVHPP